MEGEVGGREIKGEREGEGEEEGNGGEIAPHGHF